MLKLLLISLLMTLAHPFQPPCPQARSVQPAGLVQTCPPVQDQEGIEGTVLSIGGNRMPAPHHKPAPPAGIRATVYVFMLTNISQVTRVGQSAYYSAIHTPLVRQADTDENGYFSISLPPGLYSIFTKKGTLFYASRRDDKNNIAPVEVLPHKLTKIECSVESDHKPIY
jgi:hypothetical protein